MPTDATQRPRLVFAHANGFPGLSYRSLLDPLAESFDLHPLDRLGHHPDYPVNHNWGNLVEELLSYLPDTDAPLLGVGHSLGGTLMENSTDEIERCLDINLKGVLFGAQAAHPHLKKTAPGSCLLNTASAAGIYGTPGASVYSATKFGVRAVTESLDGEWSADGIKVASLMPSFIETPLLDHTPHAGANEGIRQRVTDAGLEITPVADVAAAAWAAVHGDRLHTTVGKTAKTMAFAARWFPGRVRKQTRSSIRPMGK